MSGSFGLSHFVSRLGPGVLFAVSAVGTSHVVQSTRAGAEHGAYMWFFIVAACLVRYPAFRFGAEYAASTGRSLIDNYFVQGWWAVAIFVFDLMITMFIATAAVAFVCGGVVNYLFGLSLPANQTAVLLLLTCLGVLLAGHYKALEWASKLFLAIFSLVVVTVAIKVLPTLASSADQWWFPDSGFSQETILFTVALAGWMPTALIAGSFQSMWVCAKMKSFGGDYSKHDALFDFNLGYGVTLFLALCFLLLGVAMGAANARLAGSSGEYSAQMVDVISSNLGSWSVVFSAVAILSILFSTVLALTDACPRAVSFLAGHATFGERRSALSGNTVYNLALGSQVVITSLILLFFAKSFRGFLDFATTISFLGAPLLAYINHRAIYNTDLPEEQRPGHMLRYWSLAGIAMMSLFSGIYLWGAS